MLEYHKKKSIYNRSMPSLETIVPRRTHICSGILEEQAAAHEMVQFLEECRDKNPQSRFWVGLNAKLFT